MKALKARKRYDAEQAVIAYENRKEEEQRFFESLSDEAKKKYLEDQAKQRKEVMQLLSIATILGGNYK